MNLFSLLFLTIYLLVAISFAKIINLFYGFFPSLLGFIVGVAIVYYLSMYLVAETLDYIELCTPKTKKRNMRVEKFVFSFLGVLFLMSVVIGVMLHYLFWTYIFFIFMFLISAFLTILWLEYRCKKTEFLFEQIKKKLPFLKLQKEAKREMVNHVIENAYSYRVNETLLLLGTYLNGIDDIEYTENLLDLLLIEDLIKEEVYDEIIGSCSVKRLYMKTFKNFDLVTKKEKYANH